MPVAVTPNSPRLGDFGSTHLAAGPNGVGRLYDDMSISDIKTKAKEAVQRETRGATPSSLIKAARFQYEHGRDYERAGDLPNGLRSFIKAASLAKIAIDSEHAQGGLLQKEINEFMSHIWSDLATRAGAVEDKLRAVEKSHPATTGVNDGPISKPGGTIADRLKALQEHGLSVTTSKRFSRAHHESSPPISPTRLASPPSTKPSTLVPSAPVSSAPSPHTFVPPSSLGPPSPSSTPTSSPQLNTFNLSEFTQAFPSIEELDENLALYLPSVPTGKIPASDHQKTPDFRNGESSASPPHKNFAVSIERPSSTPITPVVNTFISRPGSPAKPTIPHKPNGLTGGSLPMSTRSLNGKHILPVTDKVSPKDLLGYLRAHNVLLLDVRPRADFDREHIQSGAIVCIEPSVLERKDLAVNRLAESTPPKERTCFHNRDKFDLVVIYDEASMTLGSSDSPLSVLVRLIGEQAIEKMLKRMPMLLVGGIEAWRREFGNSEIVRGEILAPEPQKPLPTDSQSSPTSSSTGTPSLSEAHPLWSSRSRVDGDSAPNGHRSQLSLDQSPRHSRSPAEISYPTNPPPDRALARKPALSRPSTSSISYTQSIDNLVSPSLLTSNGPSTPITYPQFPRYNSAPSSGPGSPLPPSLAQYDITSPPQASINTSQSSRRRDYVDQSQEALSGFHARPSIDYPELSSAPQVLRPPPVAAPSTLERQDNRPRLQHPSLPFSPTAPKVPRIPSDYPVTHWFDTQIGTSGLKNLANTCYMNAPIQCLSATAPFARFFTEGRWKNAINYTNHLGSKGKLAGSFAKLLHEMWGGDLPYVSPIDFRKTICYLKAQYNGSDQHDSQEFLSFLLDGLHEDLNRIMVKPTWSPTPEQEAELERLPQQIASEQEWRAWQSRNDSLIVDYFQGQFRNRLECLTCHTTSTTYNVFSTLSLPVPQTKHGKVSLQRCLDAFFNTEILEKDDAWECPKCKVKRRASKILSLARLPPILLIHLKRFEVHGRFSDKIDTFVDFPMKGLDLTNLMPAPLPPGADKSQVNGGLPQSPEDPRTQLPPYRYDLYGVTDHVGNLTSGHYTAYIASRGGWMLCDDQSVKPADPKHVVSQKAYVLFYKRTKA